MATKGIKPTKRYCGRTVITSLRRDDGSGYDCTAATGSKKWSGAITLPIGLEDDGSPAMFDQLAKMAAAQAVNEATATHCF